jgi:hypothetical protein
VRLIFSRYTQLGLLRLLTNQSVMGAETLILQKAWHVYDHWLEDSRIDFYPEPSGLEAGLREATAPFASKMSPKWLGDCYLLALRSTLSCKADHFRQGAPSSCAQTTLLRS